MKRLNNSNVNSPERSDIRFIPGLNWHDIERYRELAKYYSGGIYLDLGCQTSPYLGVLAQHFPNDRIVGVDFSPRTIEFMKEQEDGVSYVCMDVYDYTDPADYIVAGEILEHMDDPKKFIDHCLSLLKSGGWLAISTPEEEGKNFWFDKEEHMWSFTEADILELMPGAEIGRPERNIIAAWLQNSDS